ncbi:MAG: tetratricopeptide repeat protein [Acidobacteriia bacterium]|nr:tetratricopeptide repeat protein [Terriglobia bacterium]
MRLFLTAGLLVVAAWARTPAERALDAQDRAALEKIIVQFSAKAQARPQDAQAHYAVAQANSLLAQLGIELGDKTLGKEAAEAGIGAARQAVSFKPDQAEYHRVLGMLCGQVIPANVMAGLKYGKCAMEEVEKAVQLDGKSSDIWLSRGVGNYYLPPMFGGGVEKAIGDLQKAVELNPRSSEAHLWLGVALRKAGRNADARKSLATSLQLNPERKWAKQQLEKTPAQ